jgi:superfamily I DNA and/or RNA helicase
MGVRINKVLSELNIGLQVAVSYLKSHKQYGDIKDDVTPNTKISDEQYNALLKEYGGIGLVTIPWRTDDFSNDPQYNRDFVNSHGWHDLRRDTMIVMPERIVLIPKDQTCNNFKFWNKKDLGETCPNAQEGGRFVKERLCEPSGTIPVTPYYKIHDEESIQLTKNTFIPRPESSQPSLSVLGKIDLTSLNTSTRPKKKTKEERRLEREARKDSQRNDGQVPQTASPQTAAGKSNSDTIRDIWKRFIDIQEKLIKQRCAPISINPESIEIEDDKLYVTVDESQHDKRIDSVLRNDLGIDEYDLNTGTILVDSNRWDQLEEAQLERIRKELSECYIELDTTPTINATISYTDNTGRFDQMSLDELYQLETIINNGNLLEGSIDNTAAFISKVTVCTDEYLKELFGDHYFQKQKEKKGEIKISDIIEYHNKYLSWDVIQKYSNIGLKCKKYTIEFRVNNERAERELRDTFDCYYPDNRVFKFKRTYDKYNPFTEDFLSEINEYITEFLEEATLYCSKDNIDTNVIFSYGISRRMIRENKYLEIANYIINKSGYSFNSDNGAIGIDFNWREQNIEELIADIETNVPFTKINVHDNHRFKCNVNTKLIGFDELKEKLEDKYEDIDVINDSISHEVRIRLPYVEANLYEPLSARLKADLAYLSATGSKISFSAKVKGKVALNIKYNGESRIEDLSDSIADMRKADFGLMIGEKEVAFGKLLKVNYPNLVFDIDVDDDLKDEIIDLFKDKSINTIIPILTGDLEKISRLKNTFTMATTGTELMNPHLQRFIFNSSEAYPIDNIELLLRHDGYVYKDICRNLLNSHINESQKQAIIKAMYADDLAVIQGPPGTGKSTAIAELIWQLVRQGFKQGNKRERILLTSETNLAVDNAISRIINSKSNLVKPIRFGGEEKLESEGLQFSIELMKRWVEEGDSCLKLEESDEETDSSTESNLILKNWLENISTRSFYRIDSDQSEIASKWRNYLLNPDKDLRKIIYDRYLEDANVVGATCSSIGDRKADSGERVLYTSFFHNYCEVFKQSKKSKARIEFTTVIQDESSKATPAELVLPFVYGQRAIVIGDHRQLPPMLDKEEFEDTLEYAYRVSKSDKDRQEINQLREFVENNFGEMEISHFQRLYENIDSSLRGSFNLQYRMHPDINQVIEQFYREDGGLRCGLTEPIDLGVNDPDMTNPASRYHGLEIPGLIGHNTHVVFINTHTPEMMDGTSRVNYGEVETIGKLLTRFEESNSFQRYLDKFTREEDKQIGIISFYGKQIRQLRGIAREHHNLPIRVSTVDRFQGMERNIVIVSMVRSNLIQSSKDQQPDKKRYGTDGYPKQKSLGFAQSPNRLNVALSRARRLLIIVGNRELFSELEIYRRLFLIIESNKNNTVINQDEV